MYRKMFYIAYLVIGKINYFIQDCINENGTYTKDLTLVDKDLSNVFILDNSPKAYKYFPGFFN